MTDARGRICGWNPSATTLFGHQKKDVLNCGLFTLFAPETASDFADTVRAAITEDGRWEDTVTYHTLDGSTAECDVLYMPVHPEDPESLALVGIQRASGAAARASQQSENVSVALTQDDDLLKASELFLANAKKTVGRAHHRMKNHLQIVSSLLSWQLKAVDDPQAVRALRASLARLNAIAFVYQHLTAERESETVQFTKYAELLVQHLRSAFGSEAEGVEIEIAESDFALPVARAVPVGIILNELLANSLEHAFPQAVAGKIEIGISEGEGDGEASIWVRDNGVGPAEDFSVKDSAKMGLQIVQSLAKQIGGELTVET